MENGDDLPQVQNITGCRVILLGEQEAVLLQLPMELLLSCAHSFTPIKKSPFIANDRLLGYCDMPIVYGYLQQEEGQRCPAETL